MSSGFRQRYLVDTHIFLWMISDRLRLGEQLLDELDSLANEVFFSAVVSWEIAAKRAKGKLHFSGSPRGHAMKAGLTMLPINAEHCETAGELPLIHHDPFDRLLIAQAQVEGLVLVSQDVIMKRYEITLRSI